MVAHGGKNRSSSAVDPTAAQHLSSSAADAAQAPLPEAIQQLIQQADPQQLRRIAVAAVDRLTTITIASSYAWQPY